MCLQNTWGFLFKSVGGPLSLYPSQVRTDQSLSGKTLDLIKSTTRTTENRSAWPAVIPWIGKSWLPPNCPFFGHRPCFFDSSLAVMVFPFLIIWLTVFWKCFNERGQTLIGYSSNWTALGQRTTWFKWAQDCAVVFRNNVVRWRDLEPKINYGLHPSPLICVLLPQ